MLVATVATVVMQVANLRTLHAITVGALVVAEQAGTGKLGLLKTIRDSTIQILHKMYGSKTHIQVGLLKRIFPYETYST